jgi:hypothetical protein
MSMTGGAGNDVFIIGNDATDSGKNKGGGNRFRVYRRRHLCRGPDAVGGVHGIFFDLAAIGNQMVDDSVVTAITSICGFGFRVPRRNPSS